MSDVVKGSLYALVGFFCMAVFGILTKLALDNGSVIWVSFIAYLVGSCILALYVARKGFGYLKSEHYGLLLGRAVFGSIASFLYTISIDYIPIVNGTLLFNTAPIFIPILAMVWLKVKVEKIIWLAVALGFIGITIIIKPTEAIFTQSGNIVGLFSGIALAVAYLLMKLLTATDPGVRIIFYYLGIGTLMQAPLLFFTDSLPTSTCCFYAIISGIVLLMAQLALVNAYRYAAASQVGIYQYMTVVFVVLLNWMIWHSVPSSWDLLGALFVAIAGMFIIRSGNATHIH